MQNIYYNNYLKSFREELKEIIEGLDAKKYVGEIKQLSHILSEPFFSTQANLAEKRVHFAKRVHDILSYCIKTEDDMRMQRKAILTMCVHNHATFSLVADALKKLIKCTLRGFLQTNACLI